MEITTREVEGVKVVDFKGNLDTNTSPQAENHLSKMLDEGDKKILVNFKNLDYISSTGLRVLLVIAKRMKSSGDELRLCSLNEVVQEVFDISGFSVMLNVFGSESEALKGF